MGQLWDLLDGEKNLDFTINKLFSCNISFVGHNLAHLHAPCGLKSKRASIFILSAHTKHAPLHRCANLGKCTPKPEGWGSSVSVLKWIQTHQVIMSQVTTKAESLFQQRNLHRALWKAWTGTQTERRLYPWCVRLAWSRYLQRSHHCDTERLLVLHPAPLQPSLTVMWLAAGPDKAG